MICRFIYAYRSKITGRFVYVGSAFDVLARNYTHARGSLAIDRELRREGRDNYALHILEAVLGTDAADAFLISVARENFWMDSLSTFRTEGAFNFSRARLVYSSADAVEAHRAAVTASKNTPAAIKQASDSARAAHARPEVKERHRKAMQAAYTSPAVRHALSVSMKTALALPAAKCTQSAAQKKAWKTRKPSIKLRKRWSADARARQSIALTGNQNARRSAC